MIGAGHYACPDQAGTPLTHAKNWDSIGGARPLDPRPLHAEIALVNLNLAAEGFQFGKHQDMPSDSFVPEVHRVPVDVNLPGTNPGRGLVHPFVEEQLQLVPTKVGVFDVRIHAPQCIPKRKNQKFCASPLKKPSS